ncbi:hypothetical protein [Burkholderia sp. WSM2230]|uniref:hypothetical protein n=1 Tax=Burkholderia sp. WSM2230 TaxID=944435 RepID=UPI00047163F2|nr:hypothetical protein [Burkholderia sp. WSM2230]
MENKETPVRVDARAELDETLARLDSGLISNADAASEARKWAHNIEKERYAAEIREVMTDYRALEERLKRIGERYPDFGAPLVLSKLAVRPNPGKAYWQARRNVLMALFEDQRTGKLEYAKLRTAYMREAELNAGYLGTLPDDIWYSTFGTKTQAVADRLLMQNSMVQIDAHGKPAEKLDTLAKLYRRIVEQRSGKPQPKNRAASCGKTFSGEGRVEFMPGSRVNWFGTIVKWRKDRGTLRCMVSTAKGRENINILKALGDKPFNVSEATVLRWIANAEAQIAAAEYSALAAQRDENERTMGWREL